MNKVDIKSKIISSKEIPWKTVIKLNSLQIDPQILKMHQDRIGKVFANASDEIKNQQVHNIVVRDNLFNKAMDIITSCYEFEINDEDIEKFETAIIQNFGDGKKSIAKNIAEKLVKKTLIFQDLEKKLNITMEDSEIKKILDEYYQATNQPIRGILEDEEKYKNAKATLLEEKMIATIIQKFPRDLVELEANMKKAYEEFINKQGLEKSETTKKQSQSPDKVKTKRK